MEKKLYTVTAEIEFDLVVMATSEAEAYRIARRNVSDEAENYSSDDFNLTVREGAHFAADEWYHSLAYGGDETETVGDICKRLGLETPAERWAREKGHIMDAKKPSGSGEGP